MTSTKRVSLVTANYTGQIEEGFILQTDLSNKSIPVTHLFLAHYHAYPCTVLIQASISSAKLHVPTIRRYLEIEHKHNSTEDIIKRQYHTISGSLYITDFLANLGNGIMFDCEDCQLIDDVDNPNKFKSDGPCNHFLVVNKVRINYLPQHELYVNGELANKLASFYILQSKSTIIQVFRERNIFHMESVWNSFQVVGKHPQQGYHLNRINIKKPFINDLSLNYGNGFPSIHYQTIKFLSKNEWKGIILLHGIPGSGKTYYIRYLINELQEDNLIYIPPDIIRAISSSELLQLLKPYSHAIIIIDDAENLNKDHPNQALNNLFNLSHVLHQPIIAAFNYNLQQTLSHIKSSSIIQHSFHKLDITSARILLRILGSQRDSDTIKQPMTLGEIHAQVTLETKTQSENTIEQPKNLKTPDEMIQMLAEQELALADKDSCILS